MHLYISCGLHYVYDFLLMQQQSSKSIHKRPKHLLKCTLANILFIISCHVASVTQTMNIQICMAYLNHKLIFIYFWVELYLDTFYSDSELWPTYLPLNCPRSALVYIWKRLTHIIHIHGKFQFIFNAQCNDEETYKIV